MLNLVGDQQRYGKVTSDDLLEGKRTLILLRTLGRAAAAERSRLVSIMSKERGFKTKSEMEYVMSLIEKYDAVDTVAGGQEGSWKRHWRY
jgi:geranylgeranyl pyrophosphate synthase